MYDYPYLTNMNFIKQFNREKCKQHFLKITLLNWQEWPIKEITGTIIDGTININASSAMRRTANLTFIVSKNNNDITNINNELSINKKIKIEIGYKNISNKYTNYPILWFPQGIYIINNISIAHTNNELKISLQLYDKMALLNGTCGGTIPAATILHEVQEQDEFGNITISHPTIIQIIQELVHHFGGEKTGKIIIKDLEPIVKQVLKWNNMKFPLYVYQNKDKSYGNILYFDICMQIFKNIYKQQFNKKEIKEQNIISLFQQLLNKNKNNNNIKIQIPELQTILKNLNQLQQSTQNQSKKIELWQNNLKKLQNELNSKNFSLISEIKEKTKEIISILKLIKAQAQTKLNYNSYRKKNAEFFNQFVGGEGYYLKEEKLQIQRILTINTAQKIYDRLIKFKSNCALLNRYYVNQQYNNISPGEILCLVLAQKYHKNLAFLPKFQINENKIISITPKKVNNNIKGYVTCLKKENEIIEGEKTNQGLIEKIFLKNQKNNQNTDEYYFLDEFINIRKEFIKMAFYKKEFKQFETAWFNYINEGFDYPSINNITALTSKTIDLPGFLLEGYIFWCDQLAPILLKLISLQQERLEQAKELRNNLLNSSTINYTQKIKDTFKNTINFDEINQYSFFTILDKKMNELKILIDKLPIKKTTPKNTKTIQYRETVQELYNHLSQSILIDLKNQLKNFDFSQQFNIDSNTKINNNIITIYLSLNTVLDKYIAELNGFYNEPVFKEYEDTEKLKQNHKNINTALTKTKKYLTMIQEYKENFTNHGLINFQEWLNTTNFNENDFIETTKYLTDFNKDINEEIFFPIVKNQKNNINIDNIASLLNNLSKTVLTEQSPETIQLNSILINKLLQKIQPYVDSNIQNTNISIEQQIKSYIQKIEQLLLIQDEKINKIFLSLDIKNIKLKNNNITQNILEKFFNEIKNIQTFENGSDIGYTLTKFIYPGSLEAKAGETVVSILDKIKNTLGNFEYFYDVHGNFIFQEIKNYLNKSYSSYIIDSSSPSYNYNLIDGKIVYNFTNNEIVQSCSSSVNYTSIKNDFLVWGERKNADNKKYPIRYHLAIDTKPESLSIYCFNLPIKSRNKENYKIDDSINYKYKSDLPSKGEQGIYYYTRFENNFYEWVNEKNSTFFGYKLVILNDNNDDNKLPQIKKCVKLNNVTENNPKLFYYKKIGDTISVYKIENNKAKQQTNLTAFESSDYRTAFFLNGIQNYQNGIQPNIYYSELITEWPKLYNLFPPATNKAHFYINTKNNPTNIDYFLDLLSNSSLTYKYGINNIGKRTKVITNNSINCIFEPNCPNIIYFNKNPQINLNQSEEDQKEQKKKYEREKEELQNLINQWNKKHSLSTSGIKIQVDNEIYKNIVNGGTARSAYQEIRAALYQYITYNEQVSLTTLPIYNLEPNQIIYIDDKEANINGEFLILSLSFSLKSEATMNISCSKVIRKL